MTAETEKLAADGSLLQAEQQVMIRQLEERRPKLETSIALLKATMENNEKEWQAIAGELDAQYGTTDLKKIREILNEERKANSAALLACAAQMDKMEQQCKEIEELLGKIDRGEKVEIACE